VISQYHFAMKKAEGKELEGPIDEEEEFKDDLSEK
jgi:hypothetical protein